MPARRLNVKALRTRLGMTQSDLARHIWGDDITGDTLRARNRTIRRWENDGLGPSPMAAKHLKQLANDSPGSSDDAGSRGSAGSPAGREAAGGPQRIAIGGVLPSMEDV